MKRGRLKGLKRKDEEKRKLGRKAVGKERRGEGRNCIVEELEDTVV